jgi:hypothetical protein
MKLSNEDAGVAYAWALANVEYMVRSGGMDDLDRILDRLAAGEAPEAAVKEVLRGDYEDLARATVEYLRKTYVN